MGAPYEANSHGGAMTSLNIAYAPDHYDLESLPRDESSKVIFSKHKPSVLIVFVHGFRGDALETWQQFDELAIIDPKFKHADLLFFGYDGYLSNVLAGSSFLFDLLMRTDQDRETLVGVNKPALLKARQDGYSCLILVAHSLGAVVSRWALLRAVEENCAWRSKVKLLLFAPAHTGSDIAAAATAAASGYSWALPFVEAAKAKVPLVKELDPGSKLLATLAERVSKVHHNEACLRASRVVIAEHEIVVSNLPFPGDPCPDALRGTDHSTVCKPTTYRREPIRFLQELLP